MECQSNRAAEPGHKHRKGVSIMSAQTLSIPDAERTATNLTAQAHSYTVAALDRSKSIPYRRLARRRAQLLTYAAGALLRFAWTYDTD
jgi:hypothetical protein